MPGIVRLTPFPSIKSQLQIRQSSFSQSIEPYFVLPNQTLPAQVGFERIVTPNLPLAADLIAALPMRPRPVSDTARIMK